jgi:hypothetical protein
MRNVDNNQSETGTETEIGASLVIDNVAENGESRAPSENIVESHFAESTVGERQRIYVVRVVERCRVRDPQCYLLKGAKGRECMYITLQTAI